MAVIFILSLECACKKKQTKKPKTPGAGMPSI